MSSKGTKKKLREGKNLFDEISRNIYSFVLIKDIFIISTHLNWSGSSM